MSMDGASHACLSLPFVSCPFQTRGLSSHSWPSTRAYNFATGAFCEALGFKCQPRFCTHLPGLRDFHAALLHLSSVSHPVSFRNEFHVRNKKHEPCTHRLNSYKYNESLDLESRILDFMNQSDGRDLFPSRSELMRAGRSDLVEAILAKGGWMVAGWDLEPSIEEQVQPLYNLGIESSVKAHTDDSTEVLKEAVGEFQNSQTAVLGEAPGLPADSTEMSQSPHVSSTVERQKRWEKVAHLFGLLSTAKEIPTTRRNGINRASAQPDLGDIFDNRRRDNACQSLPGGNKGLEVMSGVIEEKKKRRRKFRETSSAGSNIPQVSDQAYKNAWITQRKSRCIKCDDRQQNEERNVHISHRIRGLEAELVSTLDILKSGRHVLTDDSKLKKNRSLHYTELEEASDALEFCETEIMNKKRELRTARAQKVAFEGKLALELMEIRRSVDEKDKQLEQANQVLRTLRTCRIVWPNPAFEVFLAGSYDGWASWKKMEKSSAGVFMTTLQLYPGQYEIKFIVDGAWRVDPNRPRTFANGHENNVLSIV